MNFSTLGLMYYLLEELIVRAIYTMIKLRLLTTLLLVVIYLTGCIHMGFRTFSSDFPRVIVPVENPEILSSSIICAITFSSKEKLNPDWLKQFTEIYVNALQSRNIGASVRFFDTYRDFTVNKKMCHLIFEGSVERIVATGGAQTQEVSISLKITDLATDRVIFSAVQEGISRPGEDIDLYWKVIPGKTAFPIIKVVEKMANEFGKFLAGEISKVSRKSFYSPNIIYENVSE